MSVSVLSPIESLPAIRVHLMPHSVRGAQRGSRNSASPAVSSVSGRRELGPPVGWGRGSRVVHDVGRDVGGLFRTDERLYVNNRDRTKLVEGVLWQVEVVRTALSDEFAYVDVHGVLCFIGCEWGLFMRRKRIKGVTALWPKALPDHVSAPGPLDERAAVIAEHLRCRLPPAT